MKYFLIACLSSSILMAKQPDAPYITRYLNDATAAFSFTFDDGFRLEVEDALSVIDPLGIRGTFFVMPLKIEDDTVEKFISWDSLKDIHANGHEIGTHASIHPKLQEVDNETVSKIINGGWELIHEKLGIESVSFAYPGGSKKGIPRIEKIINEHHYFVRGSVAGYGRTEHRKWTPEGAMDKVTTAIDQRQWLVGMVHAIVDGYSPFYSVDEFREHCEWLVEQGDALWIAPMGEVARYIEQRDKAELQIIESSDSQLVFKVKNKAEPHDVFNHPLTIIVPVEEAVNATATTEDGGTLDSLSIKDGNIQVNVPSSAGVITLRWN
jgi:peptidoglycan/xylan/chitin deacetylase (PgdA/CDA1 family)